MARIMVPIRAAIGCSCSGRLASSHLAICPTACAEMLVKDDMVLTKLSFWCLFLLCFVKVYQCSVGSCVDAAELWWICGEVACHWGSKCDYKCVSDLMV